MRASDLKSGLLVKMDGDPHVVENIQIQTPSARGAVTLYKVRFRNAKTQQKLDKTFKGEDVLEETEMAVREVSFSYRTDEEWVFMDSKDYTEYRLMDSDLTEEKKYLAEDLEGLLIYLSEGQVVRLGLPIVVEMPIMECTPSMKGASATARTKPATLPTGLVVLVPEYLEQGQKIKVDTRTGQFLGRA